MEQRPELPQFLRHMLFGRPQTSPGERKKEKLKARLRKHIKTLIPDINDEDKATRSYAAADRIMRRQRLIDQIASSMSADDSTGFRCKMPLEPEWIRALQQARFAVYGREGKQTKRIFFPGGNAASQTRTFGQKPYVLMPPVQDV